MSASYNSNLLSCRYLSLWGDWLDVRHVAGDRQDVELVVDDNAVFARSKRQNEPRSGTRNEKYCTDRKNWLQILLNPKEHVPLIEPSHHILMSLSPVSRVYILEGNRPQLS